MINVHLNLSGIGKEISAEIEQAVDQAIHRLAVQCGKNWAHAIYATNIPDKEKLEYAKTLRIEQAGLAHYVVRADYAKADQIESGRPAYDLKRMLQTSRKVRTSKAGKKYMVIPFRWNTAGNTAHARAMPADITSIAQGMERSLVTGHRIDGGGIKRATYLWPRTTSTSMGSLPAGLAPKLAPHHVSDPYAGMRRFDTSTGKANSSQYLTFRVMHQDSSGWIIPTKPGLHIAEGVAQQLEEKAGPYVQALVDSLLK